MGVLVILRVCGWRGLLRRTRKPCVGWRCFPWWTGELWKRRGRFLMGLVGVVAVVSVMILLGWFQSLLRHSAHIVCRDTAFVKDRGVGPVTTRLTADLVIFLDRDRRAGFDFSLRRMLPEESFSRYGTQVRERRLDRHNDLYTI